MGEGLATHLKLRISDRKFEVCAQGNRFRGFPCYKTSKADFPIGGSFAARAGTSVIALPTTFDFWERQLLRTLKAIQKHHNHQRPHQGINNKIPLHFEYPDQPVSSDKIVCDEGLGGLLNHYHRDAA